MNVYIVIKVIPFEGTWVERVYDNIFSAEKWATEWNIKHRDNDRMSEYMKVIKREVE